MSVVLDTSAITAVVLGEPDAERFVAALVANVGDVVLGAPTYVEAAIVLQARLGDEGRRALDEMIRLSHAEVVPFDTVQAQLAAVAWNRFGKGRHPAALNLGDCFAYALARSLSAALLFKGDDFAQTDVSAA